MSGESYISIISGGPIQTYVHGINVQTSATTITLSFPADRIQKINFTASGQKLRLPAASNYSDGQDFVIVNAGANAFDVWTNDGSTQNIITAAVGSSYYVYLISRSSSSDTEGAWGANAFGGGGASTGANSDITSLSGLTTPLSPFQGGTGVQNSNGHTITIAGDFETSGGAITLIGAGGLGGTEVAVPQIGTLATLAGSEALTNKTVNGITITSTTATLTLASSSSFITSGAYSTTLTMTGATTVTLPTTGTLATTAGTRRQINFGTGATVAAGATVYMAIGIFNSATEGQANGVVPYALTAKNLYVKALAAPVGVETFVYTLRKNGSDTALTVTITGSNTTGNDTTHTVSFAAGDLIDLKLITSASAAVTYHNAVIESDA